MDKSKYQMKVEIESDSDDFERSEAENAHWRKEHYKNEKEKKRGRPIKRNQFNKEEYEAKLSQRNPKRDWWGVAALITSFWGDLPAHGKGTNRRLKWSAVTRTSLSCVGHFPTVGTVVSARLSNSGKALKHLVPSTGSQGGNYRNLVDGSESTVWPS
jgi:hypothetical protein